MNDDMKESLFDRVRVTTGNYSPDPTWLKGPFDLPESIAKFFCESCSLSGELNTELFLTFAREAGLSFQDGIPSGLYVVTNGCVYCKHPVTKTEVKHVE